jgi:two-component system NtrC family sensor kinase
MPAKDFVHVDKLINDVLDLLADKLKKRKITVEKSFKTISEIYVDIEMLRQAIFNIVLNALEAMENGGILRIQIETNDNFVIMKFEDSGPGISADNSDNVFLPFYSTKSVVAGGSKSFNGLGLTMAYGIIFAHGGDIVAENSHDGGAIFTIKLPIKTIIN